MDPIARKLQYKENFRCLVLDCPAGMDWAFPYDEVRRDSTYHLEMLFILTMDSLHASLPAFTAETDDRIQWIAYPKKSGNISSDLNRDMIWQELILMEFQPVSMVSLDDNWSAMRIRKNKYVRSIPKEKASMPAELVLLLSKHPECNDYFQSLSNTNQNEYIQWINGAKKEETRNKRLEKTRMLLEDKMPNPYSGR